MPNPTPERLALIQECINLTMSYCTPMTHAQLLAIVHDTIESNAWKTGDDDLRTYNRLMREAKKARPPMPPENFLLFLPEVH